MDFDEELKKFLPSVDVDEAEDVIYNRDLTDLLDAMDDILNEKNAKG